jgi:magnesium chelatase subunit I
VRADLAMLRAARAHALWHERERIELHDVEAVAALALAQRNFASQRDYEDAGVLRRAAAAAGQRSVLASLEQWSRAQGIATERVQ